MVVFVCCLCVYMSLLGFKEFLASRNTDSEPSSMIVSKLERNPKLSNNFITLKDYYCIYEKKVFKDDREKDLKGAKHLYYPAISSKTARKYGSGTGIMNNMKDCKVLIKTSKYHKRTPPKGIKEGKNMDGLVISSSSLKNSEKVKLRKLFPKINFNKVIIVEEDREPSSLLKTFSMMIGGVFLIYCTIAGSYGDDDY